MKKKTKKGFTLIELIVVIAVLGILVLLSAPKFLGYIEKSNNVRISSDIKSYETAVQVELSKDSDFLEKSGWTPISQQEMQELVDSTALRDKIGQVSEITQGSEFYQIEDNLVNSKLKGTFYTDGSGASSIMTKHLLLVL